MSGGIAEQGNECIDKLNHFVALVMRIQGKKNKIMKENIRCKIDHKKVEG